MNRIAIVCALIMVSAWSSTASAECIEPEGGWWISSERHGVEPGGSVVLVGGYDGFGTASASGFRFWTEVDGTQSDVEGTTEVVTIGGEQRVVFTPTADLQPGDLIYGNSFGGDFADFEIEVVSSLEPPTVTITDLVRRELEFVERRACCSSLERCDDPCGSTCEACEIEAYRYPVLAEFRVEVPDSTQPLNDIYVVAHELLNADEMPLESSSEQLQTAAYGSFTAYGGELPEGAEDFCVRYDVRNVLTGDQLSADVVCSTGSTLMEASRNEPRNLDTSVCDGDVQVFTSDGTVEVFPADEYVPGGTDGPNPGDSDSGTKESVGGCATGSGAPGAVLLLIGLFGIRRRSSQTQ